MVYLPGSVEEGAGDPLRAHAPDNRWLEGGGGRWRVVPPVLQGGGGEMEGEAGRGDVIGAGSVVNTTSTLGNNSALIVHTVLNIHLTQ